MGFLRKLKDALLGSGSTGSGDPDGIYLYVKCDKCQSTLRIRVDKRHDLQRDYDTGEYVLNKEMMDSSCFNLMQATIRFDSSYHIVDQEIEGGEFITEEAYRAVQSASEFEDTGADAREEGQDET
jgi:hypothetical protein